MGRAMVRPRWLSDEEQQVWRGYLAVHQLLFDRLERQLQADASMPHGYYILLAVVPEAANRAMRRSELARITRSSQSPVSHAVGRPEAGRGGDRRGSLAVLTEAGWEVLVRHAPGHVAAVRANFFDLLTPEQVRQLSQIFATVLNKLDPEGRSRLTRASRGSPN